MIGRYKTESSHMPQNPGRSLFPFTIHNICYQTFVYPANLEVATSICPLNRPPLEPCTSNPPVLGLSPSPLALW
jgi:hypothetical protein